MKYMMMIYDSEVKAAEMSEADMMASVQEYVAFEETLAARPIASEALQPTVTATTVRVRDGKTLTTDGPFVESHEQIGGFYLIDCKDLDEALEIAARIPDAKNGTIEVRPVMSFD